MKCRLVFIPTLSSNRQKKNSVEQPAPFYKIGHPSLTLECQLFGNGVARKRSAAAKTASAENSDGAQELNRASRRKAIAERVGGRGGVAVLPPRCRAERQTDTAPACRRSLSRPPPPLFFFPPQMPTRNAFANRRFAGSAGEEKKTRAAATALPVRWSRRRRLFSPALSAERKTSPAPAFRFVRWSGAARPVSASRICRATRGRESHPVPPPALCDGVWFLPVVIFSPSTWAASPNHNASRLYLAPTTSHCPCNSDKPTRQFVAAARTRGRSFIRPPHSRLNLRTAMH